MPHRLHVRREVETPGVNVCHGCVLCVCEEWFDRAFLLHDRIGRQRSRRRVQPSGTNSTSHRQVEDEQDDPYEKEHPSYLRSHNGHADKTHRSSDESSDQEQQGVVNQARSSISYESSSDCSVRLGKADGDAS